MKKTVLGVFVVLLGIVQIASGSDYQFVSADDLQGWLEADKPMLLVDIQVADEFASHHLKGSLETNAYPVKSDNERQRLEPALALVRRQEYAAVVVVCPRGKGGAKRAYDYLAKEGVALDTLFILTGGMANWPYPEWVAPK